MKDIYEECPIFSGKRVTLKKTEISDAPELLKCYSDPNAVPLFNSDNCNGDTFYYTDLERMNKAIEFWNFSYQQRYFVRLTIVANSTNEKVGTIEMFHRLKEDEFNHNGILRIDLRSDYEKQDVLQDILDIVNQNFFEAFDVTIILTKAIPVATNRINALTHNGYERLNKKMVIYDDYYFKARD